MFLGIDKISHSISSCETGSKKKEPKLLLGDKYSVNLWDELGTCVAKLRPADVKYLLKMLEISRGSFVVLLSFRRLSEETSLDFFLFLLIRLLIPFVVSSVDEMTPMPVF